MDEYDLAKLLDARDTVCSFCKTHKCDGCMLAEIVNDALNDASGNDDDIAEST